MADIFHHLLEVHPRSSFKIVQLIEATHMGRHAKIVARPLYCHRQNSIILNNYENLDAPV